MEEKNKSLADEVIKGSLYLDGIYLGDVLDIDVVTEEDIMNFDETKKDIQAEITKLVDDLTSENSSLKDANKELKAIIRNLETELLKRNDTIQQKEAQIKELKANYEEKAKECEHYKELCKPKELMLMGGVIEVSPEPRAFLEEVLTAAQSAGCTSVNFGFYGANDTEE